MLKTIGIFFSVGFRPHLGLLVFKNKEKVCFVCWFRPHTELLVFKKEKCVLWRGSFSIWAFSFQKRKGIFCRFLLEVSSSIGAFGLHGEVWTWANADFSSNFIRFGIRNDFGRSFHQDYAWLSSRKLKTHLNHSDKNMFYIKADLVSKTQQIIKQFPCYGPC